MKRAELSLQTIAVAILILIVLFVLIFAFRSQIAGLFESFGNIITGVTDSSKDVNLKDAIK